MPVWAVWDGAKLAFSSSRRSVKIRNVAAGSIATDDALSPVVIEGVARFVTDEPGLRGSSTR
jgi:hypothetical protein